MKGLNEIGAIDEIYHSGEQNGHSLALQDIDGSLRSYIYKR